jgi:hypothetical protein
MPDVKQRYKSLDRAVRVRKSAHDAYLAAIVDKQSTTAHRADLRAEYLKSINRVILLEIQFTRSDIAHRLAFRF